MRLYNFLARQIEEFKPIGNTVGLYTCGPTVYDYVHIGNWRTFVFEDILKRALTFNGYKVKHVMNLTDIDDKIIKRSSEKGLELREFTEKYAKAFFEDLSKLNILPADIYPKATDYIGSIVRIIELLLEKGFAYKGEDGIYFSVEKFKDYGKLSGLDKKNLKRGARVSSDEYDKENWTDFALWKFPKTGNTPGVSQDTALHTPGVSKTIDGEPVWSAPFGEGRPGWHIECSAMAITELGESIDPSAGLRVDRFKTIDIHTGGVDLLFPHHENEIAQSEAATGKKFVNFWMEGEHLLVEGEKMAKRLGNIYTLADISTKGFDPLALRYLFLTTHYRSKLNFTWESLKAAENALNNLREEVSDWDEPKVGCAELELNFKDAINEDLNMPKAVAVMWEMVKSDYPITAKNQSIKIMDKVLGLGLDEIKKAEIPLEIHELIEQRLKLRLSGNYEEADKIRAKLEKLGVELEDTPDGTKWRRILK